MPSRPITLAVLNDHPVVLAGLSEMLEPFAARVQVVDTTLEPVAAPVADIALLDTFGVPDLQDRVERVVAGRHHARVVVLSWDADPRSSEVAIAAGASGYVPKQLGPSLLVDALEDVHLGRVVRLDPAGPSNEPPDGGRSWPGRSDGLSMREGQIVALIARGHSNREISGLIFLSTNTIKSYIRSAYRKMGVDSRTKALLWALDHGIVVRGGDSG